MLRNNELNCPLTTARRDNISVAMVQFSPHTRQVARRSLSFWKLTNQRGEGYFFARQSISFRKLPHHSFQIFKELLPLRRKLSPILFPNVIFSDDIIPLNSLSVELPPDPIHCGAILPMFIENPQILFGAPFRQLDSVSTWVCCSAA